MRNLKRPPKHRATRLFAIRNSNFHSAQMRPVETIPHFRGTNFMIERVKRFLGISRQTGNKLIINSEKLEKRVALIENGMLEEYNIERETERNIVGSIFKGKVKNIEHGLKAMFVDIGFEKNA